MPEKTVLFATLLFFAAGLKCPAQIGISLDIDTRVFLCYESIMARVTLRNYSGNTLTFENTESMREAPLRFVVKNSDGTRAPRIQHVDNPIGNLVLGSGETRQLTLPVNALYHMEKEGVYSIAAQVSNDRLRHDFRSDPVTVELQAGVPIWSRQTGIPTDEGSGMISSRKVSVLVLRQEKGSTYCLRIENERMIFGTARIGRKISGTEPEFDIDALSNVHALVQIASNVFRYCIYDPSAKLKRERYYCRAEDTKPRLTRDTDLGRVSVMGGRLAVPGVDFNREQ